MTRYVTRRHSCDCRGHSVTINFHLHRSARRPPSFPHLFPRSLPLLTSMAAFVAGGRPPSPVDEILKNMNLTREDLARHSEQMRLFLTGGGDCTSSSTFPPPPLPSPKRASRSRKPLSRPVSRSESLVNTLARAPSPSPSRVLVKPEPIEDTLPTRTLGTMELVLERKRKERRCMSFAVIA